MLEANSMTIRFRSMLIGSAIGRSRESQLEIGIFGHHRDLR